MASTDAQFIAAWEATHGSAAEVSRMLGISDRAAHARRRKIEKRTGTPLLSHHARSPDRAIVGEGNTFIRQNKMDVQNGVIVVFTDAHIFPGFRSCAQRALLKLLPDLKPKLVIDNGDSFDGGQISRHSRIGWDKRPSVRQELDANADFHHEVIEASRGARFFWNWGNHDMRYPTRLACQAPEFEGIKGFRLEDHFPRWNFGICLTVNPDDKCPLLTKHRYRGGEHADWNNVIRAGIHILTGHDHFYGVRRFIDKRGARYGMRAGTLSDNGLPIFDYGEANPSQAASGFMVLTYHKGHLLHPQTCLSLSEDTVEFMGKVYTV